VIRWWRRRRDLRNIRREMARRGHPVDDLTDAELEARIAAFGRAMAVAARTAAEFDEAFKRISTTLSAAINDLDQRVVAQAEEITREASK
jgi:hypothetical protein